MMTATFYSCQKEEADLSQQILLPDSELSIMDRVDAFKDWISQDPTEVSFRSGNDISLQDLKVLVEANINGTYNDISVTFKDIHTQSDSFDMTLSSTNEVDQAWASYTDSLALYKMATHFKAVTESVKYPYYVKIDYKDLGGNISRIFVETVIVSGLYSRLSCNFPIDEAWRVNIGRCDPNGTGNEPETSFDLIQREVNASISFRLPFKESLFPYDIERKEVLTHDRVEEGYFRSANDVLDNHLDFITYLNVGTADDEVVSIDADGIKTTVTIA